jgi:hypothetical protein
VLWGRTLIHPTRRCRPSAVRQLWAAVAVDRLGSGRCPTPAPAAAPARGPGPSAAHQSHERGKDVARPQGDRSQWKNRWGPGDGPPGSATRRGRALCRAVLRCRVRLLRNLPAALIRLGGRAPQTPHGASSPPWRPMFDCSATSRGPHHAGGPSPPNPPRREHLHPHGGAPLPTQHVGIWVLTSGEFRSQA